jgi:hypothetical protein
VVSLEYEAGERVAKMRRRRRWAWAAIALALVFAVAMVAANRRSIGGQVARWQRDRALARAMERPAEARFPDGEVIYAVPPGFYSRTVPPPPSTYGPLPVRSVAAAAELKAAGGVGLMGQPVVFLGTLKDTAGERALVSIAFENCWMYPPFDPPSPDLRPGYYSSFLCSVVLPGRGAGCTGGNRVWLAPLSALDWKYKWQDLHVAALPLTFYGGHVDPADGRVAVIPIKLGERHGRLRLWPDSFRGNLMGELKSEVVWDD